MRSLKGPLIVVIVAATAACGPGTGSSPVSGTKHREVRLAAGEQTVCRIGDNVECWGENPFLNLGDPVSSAASFSLAQPADLVAIGDHHACLVHDGAVACWGSNLMGQLGGFEPVDTCIDRPCSHEMVAVEGLPRVRTLAAGAFHTLALDENGSVWCWGADALGQCGDPVQSVTDGPRRIDGLPKIAAIAAGGLQSFAVTGDGSVYGWGAVDHGRLGVDSDATLIAQPTLVEGMSGPTTSVEVGSAHACALLVDGTVECWGDNRFGQLGDGTTDPRPRPAPVTGIEDRVVELSAGDAFTCAVTAGGSVVCWGWNDSGQLGQGAFDGPTEQNNFSAAVSAVEVPGLPGPATSVSTGSGFACALIGDAIWCWGRNEAGQLGDSGFDDRATAAPAVLSPRQAANLLPPPPFADGRGVDLSYHTGRVDWDTVAAQQLDFAYTLSTAGVDFHDPFYDSHWRRMARVHRGAYHFFVAHDDPAEQARWFIANTPLAAGDLVPVVDIETLGDDPPDDLDDRLRIFTGIVEEHYGVKPIIYTGPKFWIDNLGDGWGDHLLWIAEYEVEAPTVPTGWNTWTLWQDRGNAEIDGVERVVDLNRAASGSEISSLTIPAH